MLVSRRAVMTMMLRMGLGCSELDLNHPCSVLYKLMLTLMSRTLEIPPGNLLAIIRG